ncbi:hypothetical protein [Halogeometricum sp. CBA1124]|uniref:hypothetical protein n=1 Tax=Halogeometricum sp. CBA1124 TaxID=2668071 RepID=UPI00142C4F42|nr:hypothetical protein [Halogeometricum sp. CBA1124]MUV57378.1 hypothetical protein [Halogeometricum sp. CBA1124]
MRLVRTLIREDDRDGVEFVDSQRFPPETKRDTWSHVTVPVGTPTDAPRVVAGG